MKNDSRKTEAEMICYMATHKTDGRRYIGITKQDLPGRISSHVAQAKSGKGGLFQKEINKAS